LYSRWTKQALNDFSDSKQEHHARIKRGSSIVSLVLIEAKIGYNDILPTFNKECTTI
jgi:hypothetical protein